MNEKMKELGITKGVVQDKNYILTSDGQLVATVNYPAVAQPNDTKFIAEAFKVANETGLMPREMLMRLKSTEADLIKVMELNKELLKALRVLLAHIGTDQEEFAKEQAKEVIAKSDPK